jgi:hypothetical protein
MSAMVAGGTAGASTASVSSARVPATDKLTFTPVADAYVDAAQPSVSFGTSAYLWVDGSSLKQSFLRFSVGAVTGRTVTDVRLRIYQTDASPYGGDVWSITSQDWDESITWDTKPDIDGSLLGTFGAVASLTWYEVSLGAQAVTGDGPVSLALDSTDDDGARWASREHTSQPQLIVELEPVESDSFTFTPEVDAYVDESLPESSFGSATSLWVDASPVKQSFLRFDVAGIAGRTVSGMRLRLHVTDAAPIGGRVFQISSNDWDESMTWLTRPSVDGPLLGDFAQVEDEEWYEADLGPWAIHGDGPISVALDSVEADGARWGSREHVEVPQLIVDVVRVPGLVHDGLSEVAAPYLGSSDPTYYAANHRLAITRTGRLLTVHGRHNQGVQLAWRDPGGGWMMKSRGDVENGLLEGGSGTGDWVASIAVAPDSSGDEHAWAVWAGPTAQSTKTVNLRRLSELDSPGGPLVGPEVTVSSSGLGHSRADLAFEVSPHGRFRGCIVWMHRLDTRSWELTATWFTDLDTDAPPFGDTKVLFTSASGARPPTLVPVPAGTRLIVRGPSGRLQVFGHSAAAPLGTWFIGARGVSLGTTSVPAGDALSSGEVLAAIESNPGNDVVTVQRVSANGMSATIDLQVTGYREPGLATDGNEARLVMIRASDGLVVSRSLSAEGGWDAADRIEIGPEGGGNYAWPNLLRQSDGRLRLVVRGPSGGTNKTAVLAFDRLV